MKIKRINNKYFNKGFLLFIVFFNIIRIFSADSLSVHDTIPLYNIFISKNDSLKMQNDSLDENKGYILYLDSLKPQISGIIITGNDITQDEIILREMKLSAGKSFTAIQFEKDKESIYNLGLFVKVSIVPVIQQGNKVLLNIIVQEKWYIWPSPFLSFTDGDLRKWTAGIFARWQNFRGRNESVSLSFGVGYNPFIRASYSVPWIGRRIHLFSSVNGSYSRDANRSLKALGRNNGDPISLNLDNNFDYINYSITLAVGKYLTKEFSVFTNMGYTSLRVSEYSPGRTLSTSGVDRLILFGLGTNYDSRNFREYTTQGHYVQVDFANYGLLRRDVNFGRMNIETRDFIPVKIANDYFITFGSRFYTSIAFGPVIPFYNHKFLGYGDDFVRGWGRLGYEGDDDMTLYNEIRVPIIQPAYVKGEKIPIIRILPYLKKFSYKYGLYFTMFYDVGGIWNKDDRLSKVKFMNGTGIGLNAILPFGFVGKIEWAFRLGKPTVGQIIIGAGAKF